MLPKSMVGTIRTKRVESAYIALWHPVHGPTIQSVLRKSTEPETARDLEKQLWLVQYMLQDVQIAEALPSNYAAHENEQATDPEHRQSNVKLACFEEGLNLAVVYLLFRERSDLENDDETDEENIPKTTYALSVQVPHSSIMRLRMCFPSISDRLSILHQRIHRSLNKASFQEMLSHWTFELTLLCQDVDEWIDAYVPLESCCRDLTDTVFLTVDWEVFQHVLITVLLHHRCIVRGNDQQLVRRWLLSLLLFLPDHKLCFSSRDVKKSITPDLYLQGTTAPTITTRDLYLFRYPCCVIDVGAIASAGVVHEKNAERPVAPAAVTHIFPNHRVQRSYVAERNRILVESRAVGAEDPDSSAQFSAANEQAGAKIGVAADAAHTNPSAPAVKKEKDSLYRWKSSLPEEESNGLVKDICDQLQCIVSTDNEDLAFRRALLALYAWRRNLFFLATHHCAAELAQPQQERAIHPASKTDRHIYESFFEPLHAVAGLRETIAKQKMMSEFNAF